MRLFTLAMAFAIVLLGQSAIVSAENQTWSDKNFDFASVTSIYLNEPAYQQERLEEITQLVLRDEFFDRAARIKQKELLTANDMEKKLLRYFLVDYPALAAADAIEADKAWQRGLTTFAQLNVQPTIQTYTVKKHWQEPYTYTTTEQEEIKIKKDDGKETTITVPKTVEHYVEGHYVYIAYVKVQFDVYSTKSGKLVFSYVDSRSAEKDRIDMYKRIVDNFYGKLKKVL